MGTLRARTTDLFAGLALVALALACFAHLAAEPGGLIVDAERPSLDHMMPDGLRGVGNDVTFLFLPHYRTITSELDRSGRLPFWDPSGFAGRPMVGNPQGGLFYPPVWVAWWFRAPSALGWLTFAHVIWGGLGAYALGRALGLSRLGALVAGGCFEAAPYTLAHAFEGHYPHVWAVSWFPWAFWAFSAHRNGVRAGTLALPAILALTLLTGHPQEWYYLVLTLSVWALIDAIRIGKQVGAGTGVVKLATWGVLLGLSLGFAAIEFFPGHAVQQWMLRGSKLTVAQATRYDPHSMNFLQLLTPFALGGPADYFGDDNYWEQLISIGLVPLVLATIAAWRHPNRTLVHGLLALTLLTLAFALGRRMGLFLVCFKLIPGMNRFRTPARVLFVLQVGAALLAGLGIDALRAGAKSQAPVSWATFHVHFLRASALLLAALVVVHAASWRGDPAEAERPKLKKMLVEGEPVPKVRNPNAPRPHFEGKRFVAYESAKAQHDMLGMAVARILHERIFWIALGGSVALIALAGRATQASRWAAWGLGLLALVELGSYGASLLRVSPARQFLEDDPVSRALADAGRAVPGPYRVRVCDAFYDDLHASSHGFEKININDWFQLQRPADLYQMLYPLFDRLPPVPAESTMDDALRDFGQDVRRTLLDRLNVGLLVADYVAPEEPWPIVATGTWKGRPFAVHRNPSVAPRAYVVPHAYPTPEYLPRELALMRAVDPREAVLMLRDPLGRVGRRQAFTPAEYSCTDSDHVVVRVTTEHPGLLVVADTWMPGWTARLNGTVVPILRGNHAQRVIALPSPGRHEVVMAYEPPGFRAGVIISAGSAALWVGACISTLRTRRRLASDVSSERSYIPAAHVRLGRPTTERPVAAGPHV